MTFNNTAFSDNTIDGMTTLHPSVQRLYQAAKDLRDVSGQSAVARLLGATPQVVKNWEARGISNEGALLAQKIIGCNANWLLEGIAQMRNAAWSPGPGPTVMTAEVPSAALYEFKSDSDWPFRDITADEIKKLSEFDRGQIEGFIKGMLQPGKRQLKSNGASD
jgi:hypothetical protein